MYFVNCRNPEQSYLNYREDSNIIYHAKTTGFCNLWLISTERIDVEGEVVVEGCRSDYHVAYASDHSWKKALDIMRKKIQIFSPRRNIPKNLIKTHYNEAIEWDEQDELLYRYFKYSLRRSPSKAVEECGVSRWRFYNFLEKLPESCTIFTDYFPETLSAYDPYLFMIETDYEDFIIELFSELPTSSSFFKVSNKLFVHIDVPKQVIRGTDPAIIIDKLYIPLLIVDLEKRKIIKSKEYLIVEYSMGKNL